jgi:hypothetical protein
VADTHDEAKPRAVEREVPLSWCGPVTHELRSERQSDLTLS